MRRLLPIAYRVAMTSAVLAAVLSAGACGKFIEKSAMNTTANILARARVSMQMESDVDLARAAIPGALKTVEGFHVANPENEKLIGMLAEGWCQYATGFVQDEWEVAQKEGRLADADHLRNRASGLFLRCMNYGLMLLPDKWSKAVYGDLNGVKALVKDSDSDDKLGMFWTALGLASAINMNRDNIQMIAHLPKAKLMLERVVELDPKYFNGIPQMALGMMYSAQARALGGNPEAAKQHFDAAVAASGGKFLLTKVMMARTYAVINQERKLFHDLLTQVLTTDPAVFPEQRLANELAHNKARRYLSQERDWF